MADTTQTPAPVVNPEPTAPAVANPATTPDNTGTIPYDRFKEVNDAKKALELKLAGIEAQQKADADKKLAQEGDYKTLLDQKQAELDKLQAIADAATKDHAARLDKLRGQLPEDKREKYASIMDANLLESLVDDFKLGGGVPTDRPGNSQEAFGGYKTFLEFANKDPKGYAAQFAKDSSQAIQIGVIPD
jgi:hypothetical protein